MTARPPLPKREAERLATLERYALLDTPPEQEFEDLVRLAAQVCEAPIALVSLVDRDRQWFKARRGFELESTPRDVAFCAYAILGRDVLLVPDATRDPRFAASPMVAAPRGIRFYAGAPLVSPEGHALGTLCVMDDVPRELAPGQVEALQLLARQVMHLIELREARRSLAAALSARDDASSRFRASEQLLRAITDGTEAVIGTDFFRSLVRHVASALGVRYVFLAECSEDKTRAFSRAFWSGEDFGEDFVYALEPTPCRKVADGCTIYHRDGLQALYPGDRELAPMRAESYLGIPLQNTAGHVIGHLVIIHDAPLDEPELALSVVRSFAARAGAELERQRADERLKAALAENEALRNRIQAENVYLQEEIARQHGFDEIVGTSAAMRAVLELVESVAPTDSTVLLTSETGTGKELIARAIHARSARRDRALIKVDCGALPADLVESELFGHERGAFTGATARRVGRFALADKGTLFLDEVGELPLETQAKLLRVLQEHEFEPLGSDRTRAVDVRLIAATNRDLGRRVAEGAFRADLYYRLNVFPITLPPLRERAEDVPLLAAFFAAAQARKLGRPFAGFDARTQERLRAYSWPGNVRELQNVIERACIVADGPVWSLDHELSEPEPAPPPASDGPDAAGAALAGDAADEDRALTLAELERRYIEAVLTETGGVVEGPTGAARRLGLHPNTLRSRLKRLGLSR